LSDVRFQAPADGLIHQTISSSHHPYFCQAAAVIAVRVTSSGKPGNVENLTAVWEM